MDNLGVVDIEGDVVAGAAGSGQGNCGGHGTIIGPAPPARRGPSATRLRREPQDRQTGRSVARERQMRLESQSRMFKAS
jgi:hypothetical protein